MPNSFNCTVQICSKNHKLSHTHRRTQTHLIRLAHTLNYYANYQQLNNKMRFPAEIHTRTHTLRLTAAHCNHFWDWLVLCFVCGSCPYEIFKCPELSIYAISTGSLFVLLPVSLYPCPCPSLCPHIPKLPTAVPFNPIATPFAAHHVYVILSIEKQIVSAYALPDYTCVCVCDCVCICVCFNFFIEN